MYVQLAKTEISLHKHAAWIRVVETSYLQIHKIHKINHTHFYENDRVASLDSVPVSLKCPLSGPSSAGIDTETEL